MNIPEDYIRELVNDRYFKRDAERIASWMQRGWSFLGTSREARDEERDAIIAFAKSIGAK